MAYLYQNPYQAGYYQPQQQIQPQMTAPQSPFYLPSYSSGILWVSGLVEAQSYPIAPNNAVALWEKSGKTVYLKSADATGKPTLRIYDLSERVDAQQDGQTAKAEEYATKEDLKTVVGAVKGFDELIASLKSDIDVIKGDMYGIAGKKKVKKVSGEVTDDE